MSGAGTDLTDTQNAYYSGMLGQASKYGGGAQKKIRAKLEESYEESLASVKETFDISMEDITLRDEEAERQANIRHDEIVGALEAQRKELLS